MFRIFLSVVFIVVSRLASAEVGDSVSHSHHGAHSTAPLAIMGAHSHQAGEWMLSYTYMNMNMDGNLDGSASISNAAIFDAGFMVAPTSMTMQMHMFDFMVGINDKLNLMVMVPFIVNEMQHLTRNGMRFTTESQGIGDLLASAQYQLYSNHQTKFLLSAGISLATGSIDERDDTPMMANAKLPYPMQLGSGTHDVKLGATYTANANRWSWGAQGTATLRTGSNDNDYTLGDQLQMVAWLGKSIQAHYLSLSLRFDDWDNIDGADPDLNPSIVPTADPSFRAGQRTQLAVGYQFSNSQGIVPRSTLGIEYRIPVEQNLEGPQLKLDDALLLSWQYSI